METRKPVVRRFTIADGMILIAAMACGLAWTGRVWPGFNLASPTPVGSWNWFRNSAVLVLIMALPCVLFLTIAVAILRVVRPRPSWWRTACQPGMTASLATLVALTIALPLIGISIAINMTKHPADPDSWRELPGNLFEMTVMAAPVAGFAVIVAWTMLAVQRRWRNELSWIDRAGRVLGVAWVLTGMAVAALLVGQM